MAPAGNAWGNITTPAIPQGAASLASGNRYGLNRGGFGYYGGGGSRRGHSSGIYAFPVYVGGYGYGYGYPSDQGAPPPPDNGGGSAQGPAPVIINQYFSGPPPDQGAAPADAPAGSNYHYYQSPTAQAVPPADSNYYLIAFKDHSVYSALAYYVEGDTLHYFTAGNVHNQVSLSLVDRQLTDQLNRQHNVDVHLP